MSKDWKTYEPEVYTETLAKMIHFSSKTVNSNAEMVGIRLGPEAALDLPYVSLRTVLGAQPVRLDYAEGGAKMVGIVSQIHAILEDDPEAQSADDKEKEAVRQGFAHVCNCAYSTGMGHVDHRLRQILVPKKGEPETSDDYVALTPITAGGLCSLFFHGKKGLVSQHNDQAKAEPDGDKRCIRQALLGIGGSKPQNVGSLARSMQRPFMVDAPGSSTGLRDAYALYYKGLLLDVHAPGLLQAAVRHYADFLQHVVRMTESSVTLREREEEKKLVQRIALVVLDMGNEACSTLMEHEAQLPQERWLEDADRFAWVSARNGMAMQGLLDPALRCLDAGWPEAMAQLLVRCMLEPRMLESRVEERLLVLDNSARASLESMIEEVFR